MFFMANRKEWLDVELNSIKALVGVIELGDPGDLFTKKILHETFNVPFAIIKRLGREQLVEDRRAYEEGTTPRRPHRAEGVTGYRLLVDMAMQLPTGAGYANIDVPQLMEIKARRNPFLYSAQNISKDILNALELEPEILPNMVKRRSV